MTGLTLSGMWTIPNASVAVVIAGLDCGTFSVALDGTVTVPWGSDPDGLLQPSYLIGVSAPLGSNPSLTPLTLSDGTYTNIVYVPVVIGYPYSSIGQLPRPMGEAQIKSPQGAGLGKTRRVHWVSALFQSAQGVLIGASSGREIQFSDSGENVSTHDHLFTGVWAQTIDDSYGFDGQVTWAINRPYPCTVVSLNTFLETQER